MERGRGQFYRRLTRPLFFALSPEGAHHLAQALLRMPLPWGRIGDVPSDPVWQADRLPIARAATTAMRKMGAEVIGLSFRSWMVLLDRHHARFESTPRHRGKTRLFDCGRLYFPDLRADGAFSPYQGGQLGVKSRLRH